MTDARDHWARTAGWLQAWITAAPGAGDAGPVWVACLCLLSVGAIRGLFCRQVREDGVGQRLSEAGFDAERVHWAVHYGDAAALAAEVGIPLHARGGID